MSTQLPNRIRCGAALLALLSACASPERAPRATPPLAAPAQAASAPGAPEPAASAAAQLAPQRRAHALPALPARIEVELSAARAEAERFPGELRDAPGPAGRRLHSSSLEDYVRCAVQGELVVWDAPPALLEAQAIASRSYAIALLELRALAGRTGPLPSGPAAQAFAGRPRSELSGAMQRAYQRVDDAIEATRGQVLVAEGCVLDARFHAACGGHTARFADIFAEQQDLHAMPSVECAGCAALARAHDFKIEWQHSVPREQLLGLWSTLGLSQKDLALRPLRRDAHGRWLEVELGSRGKTRALSFEELRQRLGASSIDSSAIRATNPPAGELIAGALEFKGLGHGHGVGLCQTGARALAAQGANAEQILAHFYPGATLARLAPAR